VKQAKPQIGELLSKLEKFYGVQEPSWPTEPYEFLVWCIADIQRAMQLVRRLERLKSEIGIEPEKLLKATPAKLAAALKPGGMFPELRALRLKELAMRVKDEFGGDLRSALTGPLPAARKTLKKIS